MAIAQHSGTARWPPCADDARRLYGVQFHPEVTPHRGRRAGAGKLSASASAAARATAARWTHDRGHGCVEQIRAQVGDGTVLAGALRRRGLLGGRRRWLDRAIGKASLTCVFVDHGLHAGLNESRAGGDLSPATFPVEPERRLCGRRPSAFLPRFHGRHRSGGKAQDHRRATSCAVFEEEAQKTGQAQTSCPGHHLPRRNRKRPGAGRRGHQEPPQRGRPARGYSALRGLVEPLRIAL